MKKLAFLLFWPMVCFAQTAIKPFDDLGRDNVTLESSATGSGHINSQFSDTDGSTAQDKTSTRKVTITASQVGTKKIPITVDFFFVLNGENGKYVVASGSEKLPAGEGTCQFSQTARESRGNYYALGERTHHGEHVAGWMARAVSADGRIVGVVASDEDYLSMAKNPSQLDSEMKSN